ncbi:MAG: radical SAM family heme chaperone HemW, partial [Rhizobacter sp.]|nr:radical SAM family heme chaperone HemW [Chlorobiales bacterium]
MAGLYFHIPFCRRRCHYCDFYFVTHTALTGKFLDAVETEMSVRKPLLAGERIETIYFGGGTPSMLTGKEIARLIEAAHQHFSVSPSAEITLEANPEDLTAGTLQDFKLAGINRLSLGTQAFTDDKLIALSRHHTAADALRCVTLARTQFDNLSLDLIFGAAGESLESWESELSIALSLQPQHLSTYSLTIEPQTPLAWLISRGKMIPPVDSIQSDMFLLAMTQLRAAGYRHYEVSNFALPEKESKH